MNKILISVIIFFCLTLTPTALAQEIFFEENIEGTEDIILEEPQNAVAVEDGEKIFEAEVLEVLFSEEKLTEGGTPILNQKLRLKGIEGEWKNKEFVFDGTEVTVIAKSIYEKGDKVLVSWSKGPEGEDNFYITDFVRRGKLYFLAGLFALVVVLTARWRGLRALIGLFFSFIVILKFIIPMILGGKNPLLVTIAFGSLMIIVSTYLVYGLNRKSSVAIAGNFLGLIIIGVLSLLFTKLTNLAGFTQEEVAYVVDFTGGSLNLQGLLLAGFVIGALGVMDDITISQTSVVKELSEANNNFSRLETYKRAMRVGVDHIASMVNTLFLAYAGAAFPLLLLFSLKQPPFLSFGQVVNNEMIATEIVRTLVGSIGLALVVPLTTVIAVFAFKKINKI